MAEGESGESSAWNGRFSGDIPDAVELDLKPVATPRPCSVVKAGGQTKRRRFTHGEA